MNKAHYYTPEWYALKGLVLQKANWVCLDCGWPRAVVVHHLTYEYGILCPSRYLAALCDQCHRVRHGLTNWRREPYEQYMRRKGWVRVAESGPGCMHDFAGIWKPVSPEDRATFPPPVTATPAGNRPTGAPQCLGEEDQVR